MNRLLFIPSRIIFSLVCLIYFPPISVSPIFIQFMPFSSSVKNCCIGRGEPPREMLKISPNLTHTQFSGMAKGISSSLMAVSGLLFFCLPVFCCAAFSAWIWASRSRASSLVLSLSLPSIAACKTARRRLSASCGVRIYSSSAVRSMPIRARMVASCASMRSFRRSRVCW